VVRMLGIVDLFLSFAFDVWVEQEKAKL